MASGFITLRDGSDWGNRWSGYDLVLETIMRSLPDKGHKGYLKRWLQYILPNEENGDIESGYCFYKKTGTGEDEYDTILRIIDTRLMRPVFRRIFWQSVEKLNHELDHTIVAGYLIHSLFLQYQESILIAAPATFEQKTDVVNDIFLAGGFRISFPKLLWRKRTA